MRTVLSHESVVDAGVRVVEGAGWEALSLRAVASELGVTPMALYRHAGDSEALTTAVVEAIVRKLPSVTSSGDAATDLSDWARSSRRRLSRYPGVAAHLLTMWFDSPAMLERVDDLLGIAFEDGLEGFEAVAVTNAVFTYVLMRCEAERTVRSAGAVRRQLRTAGASRPLHRLESLARHYTTAEFDAHFEFGLQSLIAGMPLAARSARTQR